MPTYQRLGDVPRKRHIQFRDNGRLLTEEVMGLEGFDGNESILYHLQSPCRVRELGSFEPIERDEWVPDAHAHRHFRTMGVEAEGNEITGRKLLMWNADVEISLCCPTEPMDFFYRNGEGDEVIFVHEGSGTLETIFGDLPYKAGDYVVVPRGTTYRFVPEGPQRHLVFESPGLIEIPAPLPERVRAAARARAVLPPRHPPADRAAHASGRRRARGQGARQGRLPDVRPRLPPVRRRRLGRLRLSVDVLHPRLRADHGAHPHAAARPTRPSPGRNFVICSFCPRKLDFDPMAIPIPYHHSNLNSEEMIYYVDGQFGSRKGIEVGSVTLHPSGIPHGPQPGLAEKSIGMTETHELAVMCDTFHPLRLTKLAKDLDDGKYAYSWYEEPDAVKEAKTADEDPAGVTSHF